MKPSVVLVSLFTLCLSGCFASSALEQSIKKSKDKRWIATDMSDTIIAIGKPAKPIQGYENALVLAGQKHSYLIHNHDKTDSLKRILDTMDLRYLHINLPTNHQIAVKQSGNGFACTSSFGCAERISLSFKKPLNQVKNIETEKQQLRKLNFYCSDVLSHHTYKTHLVCDYITYNTAFIPIQSAQNHANLTHRFKEPVPITHYEFRKHKGQIERTAKKALIPLALAFDIVTFPIQINFVDF